MAKWITEAQRMLIGGELIGGFKNSGVGREEGIEELYSYTESKTINIVLRNS